MERLTENVSLDDFFRSVSAEAGPRPVLLLDYDGTLAPFQNDRDRAVPYEGVRPRLNRLLASDASRIVLVSGRPVADVERLAGLDQTVEIWGTHGWERRLRDGTYVGPDLPAAMQEILDNAADVIHDEVNAPDRCERKPASVAFHVRDISPNRASDELAFVRERWSSLLDRESMVIEPFDGGLELRVKGKDKGVAVASILEDVAEDAPVAYLGDDLTDEDAFAALDGRGLRVLVRRDLRDTRADFWAVPPDELYEFLDRWTQAVETGTG